MKKKLQFCETSESEVLVKGYEHAVKFMHRIKKYFQKPARENMLEDKVIIIFRTRFVWKIKCLN